MAVSRLNVLVGAKIQGLQRGLKSAKRSLRKFERSTAQMGRTLTRSLTAPMLGFAAVSIKAFDKQAKAEAGLRTALGQNEAAFKSLTIQAKELQKVTLYGDEETIAAQTMLATMGLEEEAIKRLIPLVQDMATVKGMNLKAAADLVAKSVGSSTNALSRYGITIEGAVGSTERLDSAVGSLSTMFSGQATKAAEAGAGAWVQLKNSMMDFAEEVGAALMPMIDPLKDKLEKITERLGELSTAQITAKIKTGLFVAAVGPMLLVLSKLAAAIRILTANPIMMILTGIVALAYKLKNDFTPAVTRAFIEEKKLYELRKKYGKDLASGKRTATGALDVAFMAGQGRGAVEQEIKQTAEAIDTLKASLGKYVDMPIQDVPLRGFDGVNYKKLRKNLFNTEEDLANLNRALKRITNTEKEAANEVEKTNKALKTQEDNADALTIAEGQLAIQLAALRSEHAQLTTDMEEQAQLTASWNDRWQGLSNTMANDVAGAFATAVTAGGNMVTNLGDAFKSLLIQMGQMVIKAAIFAAIMTAVTGGGFGGAAMAGGTNFASIFQSALTGRATGGNVLSGTPYLVGEHGPELFSPSGSSGGQISSAAQTAQMGIPDVKISGEDLIIVFDRAVRHRKSLG